MMNASEQSNDVDRPTAGIDYRTVWRWHFYSSFFCIPLVLVLSITGGIYLFRPQIEAWIESPYDGLTITSPQPVSAQVRAAIQAVPDGIPTDYELPRAANGAGRVIVKQGESTYRVFIHPESLEVLGMVDDRKTFVRQIRSLHGQLGLGERGSYVVETIASWTIVMILTGIYLWWPRGMKSWGGILYPRLFRGSRLFWRDIHSVSGIWISSLALFLIATGLPWAKFWGNYFRTVREVTHTSASQQDWTIGGKDSAEPKAKNAGESKSASGGEHAHHQSPSGGRRRGATVVMPADLTDFDRVHSTIAPLDLAYPVLISPPRQGATHWIAKSDSQNRTLRTTLQIDGKTGAIVSREDFKDRHWVDRAVGMGIAAHEGALFGWLNQLLGLIAAGGLVLLSLSGYIMWWKRREVGVLGAPRPLSAPRWTWGLLLMVATLAVYLPLFALTLAIMFVIEKTLLRRIPRLNDWLGLRIESTTSPNAS